MKRVHEIIEDVFGLYEQFGGADYIGEPVSQLEHMSQSAALAIHEGYDDEIILAAFFHDIGHICQRVDGQHSMGNYGTVSHEKVGADFLRACGFPERIARLVENHVQAKRYLTYKHPEYYNALSEASRITLEYQGGMMTTAEALTFESDPLFEVSIKMRQWDELAKEKNIPVLDLTFLKTKAIKVLAQQSITSIEGNNNTIN
jgi:2-amino-1-hydroxyethylphosphonate dioxygenase (glycine-forming)